MSTSEGRKTVMYAFLGLKSLLTKFTCNLKVHQAFLSCFKNLNLIDNMINPSKLQVEKLSDKNLLLTKSFDCGDQDLNEFLKDDALKHQKERIAATYICFYEGKVVGYFSWLTDAIEINGEDKRVFKKIGMDYKTYPAVKLGRLAIDKTYAKSGVGSYLVKNLVEDAIKISEKIGCRYLTVDAYSGAKRFYEKLNFKLPCEKGQIVSMYSDILS